MILLIFALCVFFGTLIISFFMGSASLSDLQRRHVVRARTTLDSDRLV